MRLWKRILGQHCRILTSVFEIGGQCQTFSAFPQSDELTHQISTIKSCSLDLKTIVLILGPLCNRFKIMCHYTRRLTLEINIKNFMLSAVRGTGYYNLEKELLPANY